jgi:hypothetical protein
MRPLLFATLLAAGIGLVGTAPTFAAPASGAAIGDAATLTDAVEQAQVIVHGRRRSHFRFGSGGPRCVTTCRHRGFTSARVCRRVC